MINEKMFQLKKNGEPGKNCYCRDVAKIENYSKAVLDTSQIWHCHHRRETHYLKNGKWIRREFDLTAEQLVSEGVYYDVPPSELIFLTQTQHKSLHKTTKGKQLSEETKEKISKTLISREHKKVLCIETGEIFDSAGDAQRKTGICRGNISGVCNSYHETAGGFHWKYYAP